MSDTTGSTLALATDRTSQLRTLTVAGPAANDARLPAAAILEGNVIDLSAFAGDAHVNLKPWILAAPGQGVWLWITYDGGSIDVLSAHVVTEAEVLTGVNLGLPRNTLANIKDGTILVLHAAVSFDGSTSRPPEGYFPPNAYVLRANGTGGVFGQLNETFLGITPGTPAFPSYDLPSKTMSVTASSGATFIEIYEPTAIGLSLPRGQPSKSAAFELNRPAWLINAHFDAPIYPGGGFAVFHDETGSRLASVSILTTGQSVITYAAPPSQRIKKVVINNNAGTGPAMVLRRISGLYDAM